jgi:hypothetical protein
MTNEKILIFVYESNRIKSFLQIVGGLSSGAINSYSYSTFRVGPASGFYVLTIGGFSTPPGQLDTM